MAKKYNVAINFKKIWNKLSKKEKSYKFYRACLDEYIEELEKLREIKNFDKTLEKIEKNNKKLNELRGCFKTCNDKSLKRVGNFEEFIKIKEDTFKILKECPEFENYFYHVFNGYKIDYSSYGEAENISFILSLYIVLAIYKKDANILDEEKINKIIYEAGIEVKEMSKKFIKISVDIAKEEIEQNC